MGEWKLIVRLQGQRISNVLWACESHVGAVDISDIIDLSELSPMKMLFTMGVMDAENVRINYFLEAA
ncbi:MAG: hypothetical protein JW384_02788 [Nitrosomonadaceae bacterium]|nr:hypothetical protein [Nitrosomonadaceae bacterium]